jgi:hypothetical protein
VPGSDEHLEYMARARDFQRGGEKGVLKGRKTPKGFRAETTEQRTQRRTEQAQTHLQAAGAAPGSMEHSLATMRMGLTGVQTTGKGRRARLTLPDIRSQRQSDEGALSPEAHTAEDTWMHAISTRQRPESVRGEQQKGGSGSSISKTAASDPNLSSERRMSKTSPQGTKVMPHPDVQGAALNHAVNNYTTRKAAGRLGGLPATMVQEVPWTEERIRAGKDPEYSKEMAARKKPIEKLDPPLGRQYAMPTPIHHAAAKSLYERVTSGGPAATPKEIKHVERLQRQAQ